MPQCDVFKRFKKYIFAFLTFMRRDDVENWQESRERVEENDAQMVSDSNRGLRHMGRLLNQVNYSGASFSSTSANLYIINVEAVDIDSQTLCIIHYLWVRE